MSGIYTVTTPITGTEVQKYMASENNIRVEISSMIKLLGSYTTFIHDECYMGINHH